MKIVLSFDAVGFDKEYPDGVWPEGATAGKTCAAASSEELMTFVRESLDESSALLDFIKLESVSDSVEEDTSKPDWNKLRQLIQAKTMLRLDSVIAFIKEWLGS